MKRVLIRERKIILEDFFKVEEASFSIERQDGTMTPSMRRLTLERGDSVAAVVVDVEREMLLLARQFRYATWANGPGWMTEIVAGVLNLSETPDAAMRREIAEEIGYRVKHLEPIATFYLSPGGSSERVFLFYAEVRPGDRIPDHEREKDPEEDIVLVELPLRELPESILEGEFRDAKTIIAVSWLTQRLARAAGTTVGSLVSKKDAGQY